MTETAKKRKIFALLILVLNVALLAMVAIATEVYLAWFGTAPRQYWGWRDIADRPAEQNQLGFRGQPIIYSDKDFIVLLVGDSQVQADACSFELMPERRLQYHLEKLAGRPVRVFSVGASGYGQDQQLFALQEYFQKHRADLVIVWETTGNDVWNNMFPTHWPKDGWPKPTFWVDARGALRGPNADWGAPLHGRFRAIGKIQRWLTPSLDESWERNRLPAPYQPRASGRPVIDTRVWKMDPLENFFNEKTHYSLYFTPASERTRYGVSLTNRLLKRIEALAEKNGARFAAFCPKPSDLIPDGFFPVRDAHGRKVFFQFSQAQYWDNIRKMNHSLPFLTVPVTVKHSRVSDTDKHLNYRAVDQVMWDLALALQPMLPDIFGRRAETPAIHSAGDDDLLLDDLNLVTLDYPGLSGFRYLEGPYPQWEIPLPVRWMNENRAEAGFYHTGRKELNRFLKVKARTATVPQSLKIECNGELVLSAAFSSADQWHTWTTEAFAVRPGDNSINLEADNSIRPDPGGRPLFILFEEIRLSRSDGGASGQKETN